MGKMIFSTQIRKKVQEAQIQWHQISSVVLFFFGEGNLMLRKQSILLYSWRTQFDRKKLCYASDKNKQ